MCSQSTPSVKHTCIIHMNNWSDKTVVIEPMCLLLCPSLKIPPCLIRTHPPHLRYVCHWRRPKVFKLGWTECALLHTETHERVDESFFRAMSNVKLQPCLFNSCWGVSFWRTDGLNAIPRATLTWLKKNTQCREWHPVLNELSVENELHCNAQSVNSAWAILFMDLSIVLIGVLWSLTLILCQIYFPGLSVL